MFESRSGTETVDVPQEAIDVMVRLFGRLQSRFSNVCIAPERGELGPFSAVSYGKPYFADPAPDCDTLHLEYTGELQHDLDADTQLFADIREMRERMRGLGFDATTNTDQRGTESYGDWYDKHVPAAALRDEINALELAFAKSRRDAA